jgi:hypothetical protein
MSSPGSVGKEMVDGTQGFRSAGDIVYSDTHTNGIVRRYGPASAEMSCPALDQ